ncbi:MAG: hypothetical protein JSU96_20010 [Acidobacteriota bacterium]|nr:MAG: hypothetical protein JSU96_20010 [Acidobacteriota bacterium]
MKQIRADREKAIRKEGGNVPFPGCTELLAERGEESPQIVLTVTDSEGNMIRHLPGPSTRGFHRVAWDLRYPGIEPIQLDEDSQSSWNRPSSGPLVLSGRYNVTLSKLVDGKLEPLSPPQEFDVAALGGSTLPVQDPQSVLNFQLETADLMRRALAAEKSVDEAETRIKHIRKALLSTPEAPPDLMEEARRIEVAIADLKDQLDGDPVRRSLSEARSPGFIDRLRQIARGHWQTTYGPTQTHRRDLEIAQGDWEVFYPRYRQIVAQDLVRLEESLERAGAPHTPGRTIP